MSKTKAKTILWLHTNYSFRDSLTTYHQGEGTNVLQF